MLTAAQCLALGIVEGNHVIQWKNPMGSTREYMDGMGKIQNDRNNRKILMLADMVIVLQKKSRSQMVHSPLAPSIDTRGKPGSSQHHVGPQLKEEQGSTIYSPQTRGQNGAIFVVHGWYCNVC